jgi:hypothetical protein
MRSRSASTVSFWIASAVCGLLAACSNASGNNSDDGGAPAVDHAAETDAPSRDATSDPGECTCISSGAGFRIRGAISLACYCAGSRDCDGGGDCPSFDTALAGCKTFESVSSWEEYAGCNLAFLRFDNMGFNGKTYVYDLTTHTLVGVEETSKFPDRPCGFDSVHRRVAGRLPEPTCLLTRQSDHCMGVDQVTSY